MGRGRKLLRTGWISLDKRYNPHRWVAHWYTGESYLSNGVSRYRQRSLLLGFKTKDDLPTKSAAESKWAKVRDRTITPEYEMAPVSAPTFSGFVQTRFIPARESGWKPRSRERFQYLYHKMEPVIGNLLLADIDRVRLQKLLDCLAKEHCYDTVHLTQTYLQAIFSHAVDEDIIEKSPARGLTIPNFTRDRDETILSLEAVRQFEDVLEGKDKILWQLLSRCGLRAGEVFGLQWQDLTADHSLRVQRIYARGKVSEPKTKKSKAPVVVPVVLYKELVKLRECAEDGSDGAWVFPSSRNRRGTVMPIDYHNWLNRTLRPVSNGLGIRVNHLILRRTFATLAYNSGGDLKDIQAQMRHASVNTTANIYTKPIPQSVRNAVEALDRRIRKREKQQKTMPKASRKRG